MKNIAVFLFSMLVLHMNAQQKIERLYILGTGLLTGQYYKPLAFFPAYELGATGNLFEKHSISAGYSSWKMNELEMPDTVTGPRHINSQYKSFHVLYGRFKHFTPQTCFLLQIGPSLYHIKEAHNFRLVHVDYNAPLSKDYYYYDYDVKSFYDVGIVIRAEAVINFLEISGFAIGCETHLSAHVRKFNLRIGIPLGYFQQVKKGMFENHTTQTH